MQRTFTDQLHREVILDYPPKRIISLVPSQTELLFDLGLDEEIIAVTTFCIHPGEKVKGKAKVGGTKNLDIELIRSLKPDLIIGNKEENVEGQIVELMLEFPVWMSDVNTLEDAKLTIHQLGEMVDRAPEAAYLNHLISAGFNDLQTLALQHNINKKVAYFIWKHPYMVAGQHTFINHILAMIGFSNVVKSSRYPAVELSDLQLLDPDVVFLSSEPYPFREKHIKEIEAALPRAAVMLVDGEMFSWYGSRLVKAVQYLFQLQKEFK
ncbi:helical backbone metal receptor [Pedobacter immunditicola]|uniref:helical backbone metal receptor n=1 Tax=Pedobacter immunditicola TaxID=3133440 RepID=UPI0030A6D376